MTFQTQFAKGYDYSVDPDVFISRFMSPGYLLIGAGFTWTPKSWFTATFTPATWRGTFVSSKILSDQGDFGVTPVNTSSPNSVPTYAWKPNTNS